MRSYFKTTTVIFISIWSCAWLVSCSNREATPIPDDEIYRPPPVVQQTPLIIPDPSATPTQVKLVDLLVHSPTPDCVNNLLFLEDLTIPDKSIVQAGAQIDKRWRIENSGTCNWDRGYQLTFVSGEALNAPRVQALFPARASTQVNIRMIFTAPQEAGTYRSSWQVVNPNGEPFGDIIYMEIIVQ
jgi:hypothetical protein